MRLRVIEVLRKGWLRSHVLVEAEQGGELFFGNFHGDWFKPHRYLVNPGQRLYLVCRGGGWRPGDDVPKAKIVYRYEP